MIRKAGIAACLLLAACGGGGGEEQEDRAVIPLNDSAAPAQGTSPVIDNQAALDAVPPIANEATPAPEPTPSYAPDRVNADGTLAEMPGALRGRWAGQGGSCADTSERRLDIEANRLIFYESVATPRRIERIDARGIRLDLAYTGEGESWTRSATLVLGEDNRTLRRSEDGVPLITYTRCPEGSE